jgi:hypothetical protein
VTIELNTELHGLQKFANYSIRAWAYTRIGDGEKSSPIFCRTDEDGKRQACIINTNLQIVIFDPQFPSHLMKSK